MGRFVEYARSAKQTTSPGVKDNFDIENTLAPAALKLASQLLFESLKLHRSGSSQYFFYIVHYLN
jgi:hypothetical protein